MDKIFTYISLNNLIVEKSQVFHDQNDYLYTENKHTMDNL